MHFVHILKGHGDFKARNGQPQAHLRVESIVDLVVAHDLFKVHRKLPHLSKVWDGQKRIEVVCLVRGVKAIEDELCAKGGLSNVLHNHFGGVGHPQA